MKKIKKIFVIVTIISMFSVLGGNFFILNKFEGSYKTCDKKNYPTDLEVNPILAGNISIFQDDFESGLSKWDSVTGLWHLTDNVSYSDPYHSPTHSIWFGNESTGFYYNGSWWARGNLTSIPIDLSSELNAYLEFYHWKEVEEYSIFDNSSVFISTDNVIWDMLYQNNTNKAPWEKLTFNISSYCGNSSVRIRFYFDSVDEQYNNFRGWLVDDVRIYYTVDNNNPPTLTLGSVSPNPGKLSDLFTYTVNYMDIDGDAPAYVNVSINGTYYSMSKQNPYDYEYTDGCIYEYKTYLEWSAYPYNYSFGCSDGKYFANLGPYIGPVVEWGQLFDGIYINNTLIFPGMGIGPSKFSYSYDSGHIFNVNWDSWVGAGSWDVNLLTRIMSNHVNPSFGSGVRTPAWIFTNVSLNDSVPISVGGEGDHIFNVSDKLIYDLPGYGLLEVWVLIDTDGFGGIAWYEKSTGILLNGTFVYSGGAANYSFVFNDTNVQFTYFVYPPSSPSISINGGDASTNSTLVTLTLSAVGATEMCFKNGTTGTWTSWEAYSTTKQLYLEGSINNTAYTIQVKFQNSGGESSIASDSILYLIFTPLNPSIIINNGDATTDSVLVTLTLSADGATEMCFRNGTDGTWTSWEAYSTTKQLYLEGSTNNTAYSIYVKFRNAIGETSPVGDSILYLILTIPSNPSIVINNGDASTDNQVVTLTLSADGATEMCFRNGTTGTWTSWESYSTTKQVYLEGSINNTEYSIYVKFRNTIGETSPVNDSILYLIIEDGDGDGDGDGVPEIPGYPLELLLISLVGSIGIILLFNKKKKLNSNK